MLDDLAGVVQAAVGSLAVTKSFMPDSPNDLIAMYETGGSSPVDMTGSLLPGYERPRVQILSRSKIPETARLNAEKAYQALVQVANQGVNGTRYLKISAVQSPFQTGRDTSNRVTYAVNLEVWKELSSVS
jgi:hypothetical protein